MKHPKRIKKTYLVTAKNGDEVRIECDEAYADHLYRHHRYKVVPVSPETEAADV